MSANPTPPNIEREELREKAERIAASILNATTIDEVAAIGLGASDIVALVEQAVKDGEQRGAAFAIGVIDELHIGSDSSDTTDRLFKGLKNTIRDRFKAATGVDPAPRYPINVRLTATPHQKEEGGE